MLLALTTLLILGWQGQGATPALAAQPGEIGMTGIAHTRAGLGAVAKAQQASAGMFNI
tara:strand:+ start:12486 stop:12659 length:174 start_codon:yes stop_codon:yes gene_type:complete